MKYPEKPGISLLQVEFDFETVIWQDSGRRVEMCRKMPKSGMVNGSCIDGAPVEPGQENHIHPAYKMAKEAK